MVTEQAPVPVHAPLHPVKTDPTAGLAVSATTVPGPNPVEQVTPQLMPAGFEVTVPDPAPALETVSAFVPQLPVTDPEPSSLKVVVAAQPATIEKVAGEAPPRVTAVMGTPPTYSGGWKEGSEELSE
jgi:hypothetical protein